ncbi:MAG TPA: DNA polymerase domain-containing protein [Armatimonadota bacterium]|nr:DNA polymerase domain-containing protein [Armatimonadota bacterium]
MADAQTILFGADTTQGIVAVEVGESEAAVYIRQGNHVTEAREPFTPWLILSQAQDVPSASACTELSGEGYRFLVTFPSWPAFVSVRNALRMNGTDHVAYPSAEKQFLLATGKTLFKGLTFDDIHRMQLDIETAGLSSEPESSRILLIALSDNRGREEILEGEESDMLGRLATMMRELDADVIEGHNILGFDLPFLSARARRCGVRLTLGRDGSELSFGTERSCPIGGYSRPFTPAHIYGRHVIDTLLGVQRFDVGRGRLERHSLKESARALGLSEPDRVLIPGEEIAGLWTTDPETVRQYARQDVRETRSLAALVCPPEFYLTQMVPDSHQTVATTGTGEKINSILIRDYLRQGHAIPRPQPSREIPGGYTELRASGLIRSVIKCDVESLYPSLMLSRRIKPASDALDVFLPALAELTRRRIDAKGKSKSGPANERAYWDGLQNSFKVLINSFYGYLGAPFNFNDFEAAAEITTSGQAIVKQIAESIERNGGKVIEIDTDGVYFEAPPSVETQDAEIALVHEIGRSLPEGINLVHDGRYAAMLSLKVKNYVLIGYDGKKTFRGASVRSRADEPFGREFISQAVDLLLANDRDGVSRLYHDLIEKIQNGQLPVEQFARRERVTSKTFSSAQKKRSAAVAQGVAIGDYIRVYEKKNGELGLMEDYIGDEDKGYLLDKLYKFACRLREAFGDEFNALFPAPGRRVTWAQQAESAGQQKLDLL